MARAVRIHFDGHEIHLKHDPDEPISRLKEMLHEKTGLPVSEIKIYFQGPHLEFDDHKTLRNYGLQFGAFFYMSDRKKDPKPAANGRKASSPKVSPNTTPKQIINSDFDAIRQRQSAGSNKILEEMDKEDEQQKADAKHEADLAREEILALKALKKWKAKGANHKPKHLRKSKTTLEPEMVQKVNLRKSKSNLEPEIVQKVKAKEEEKQPEEPKPFTISVQTPNYGKVISLQVEPSDTTESIKEKIVQQAGIPFPHQILKDAHGREIPNSHETVQDLGLREGDQLTVDLKQIPVTVRMTNGRETKLIITPCTDTIADLKHQLEKESGWAPSNQKLSIFGVELANPHQLAGDCGIEEGSVLELEPKTIHISVKTPNGKTEKIEVQPSDTTEVIQEKIAQQAGVPVAHQDLTYNGREMAKGKTARDLGLQDGSEVKVEIRKMPVTVRTNDGKEIQLIVDPTSSTIGDLKQQLETHSGIPISNQTLSIKGKELTETHKLASQCGIKAGDILDLEPKTITIAVKTPSGKTVQIEVQPSDTTSTLKEKIAKETGIKVPQQVIKDAKGTELPISKSIKEMGLKDGSEITVDILQVPITVRTNDGKEIKLMVDPAADTIADLKKQLEKECGVSVNNQMLFISGKELADSKMLAGQCGIQAGTVLDLEPKTRTIKVKAPGGKTLSLQVEPTDTTESIKAMIEKKHGIPYAQQVLRDANGSEIVNGKTIQEMKLQDGSEISVGTKEVSVTVRTNAGKEVQLLVNPSVDTIADMKKKLQEETGITVSNQKLSMNGTELDTPKKLAMDYQIYGGAVLDLEPRFMTVRVKTPDGKWISIKVEASFTSRSIKERLVREAGIPITRQVLEFNGKEFPNFKTVKDMGIQDGSELSVDILKVPVKVRTHNGQVIQLMVDLTDDTILDLKQQLEAQAGIPLNNQKLSMLGIELAEAAKTAGDSGIQSGTVLDLEPNKMSIAVKTPGGKVLPINVQPSDTVGSIKERIAKKAGMEAPQLILLFNGRELLDSNRAEDCGLQSGCTIQLESKTMDVAVKTPDGSTVSIQVKPSDTTEAIKDVIAKKVGIDAVDQVLNFNGKELSDSETMEERGVKNGSEIILERAKVPVTINTDDGKQLNLMLDPTDTMNDLKAKLEQDSGIPLDQQKLCLGETELADPNKTVEECKIKPGSFLTLERKRLETTAESQKNRLEEQKRKPRKPKKETKPKKELSEKEQRKCFMWYARMAQPDRETMIRKVKKLGNSCDITVEDVEALPWMYGGAMLNVKEMNELFLHG